MAPNVATNDRVDLAGLLEFVGPRHQWVLGTVKKNGWPQLSPVTGGVTSAGKLTIATYPSRDKSQPDDAAAQPDDAAAQPDDAAAQLDDD